MMITSVRGPRLVLAISPVFLLFSWVIFSRNLQRPPTADVKPPGDNACLRSTMEKSAAAEPPGISKAKYKIDYSKKYDVCTVGAGLSGAIFAERFANVLGKTALVLDSRHHIGGNCYDFVDKPTGVLMNKYGAHLFRTNDERAWRYINLHKRAPKWVAWQHEVRGWIRGKLLPIPVNIYTVNALFNLSIQTEQEMREWLAMVQIPCPKRGCETAEQLIKSRVGEDLYNAIFYDYTVKQWNKKPGELKPAAAARIPVYSSFDPRYFTAKYQVLPSKGYTAWFAAVLDNPLIDVVLRTNFLDHRQHLEKVCKLIVYTGPIDSYFGDSGLDKLEYRSIDFVEKRYFNVGYVQAVSVVNYPSIDVKFTRSVEYKHFLFQESTPHSIVVSERSTDKGDPYYPVPSKRNLELYAKYKKLAESAEEFGNLIFVGRLANYKYFSMDEAIVNAVELFYKTAKRLGFTDQLGDYSGWMKMPPKVDVRETEAARVTEQSGKQAASGLSKITFSPESLKLRKAEAAVASPALLSTFAHARWRGYAEKPERLATWVNGEMKGLCFGLRPGSVHSPEHPVRAFSTEKEIRTARVAIILRGHFRETDSDSEAVDNLRSFLNFFPKAKVFLQTWSVRQTSHSWRQHKLSKMPSQMVMENKTITDYYKIPPENFGGLVFETEQDVLPKLRALYRPEEIEGVVCSGVKNPSMAPNIGWLQMWWGVTQAAQLVVQNAGNFDAVLNLRHDAYQCYRKVIPDWTRLRDLVVKYLENYYRSPIGMSCWLYQTHWQTREGIDTAWVMSVASNYKLGAKWLYQYKLMQEVFCGSKPTPEQEEMVAIASSLLL